MPLADRPIQRLSFGQQKRICLAGVLAMQPSILVLDEPTAGLDPVTESQTIELLVRLNRHRNITTIVSTHCMDLLPVLADRIYVLSRDGFGGEGPPREVLADRQAAHGGWPAIAADRPVVPRAARRGMEIESLPLTVDEARRRLLAWLDPAAGNGPLPGSPL